MDALLTAEVDQQWGKRVAQWRKEKEARRKLMDDICRQGGSKSRRNVRLLQPLSV